MAFHFVLFALHLVNIVKYIYKPSQSTEFLYDPFSDYRVIYVSPEIDSQSEKNLSAFKRARTYILFLSKISS